LPVFLSSLVVVRPRRVVTTHCAAACFQSGFRQRLKAAAEKAAKQDVRSVSSFIEKLPTEHLKAKGYLK
jgi:hypothetical protein